MLLENSLAEKALPSKTFSFWNETHEELVRWNLELQIAEGGTGLVPQWKLADASYAASWFQPLRTIAQANQQSEIEFLNH